MQILLLTALLCCLVVGFAVSPGSKITQCKCKITWCTISTQEHEKCMRLAQRAPTFSCLQRSNPYGCMLAIKNGEADAITLNGEYIYKAGQRSFNLVPIIAEKYEACSYGVAVAKKGTTFSLKQLRGKKSCHSGLTTEGWTLPIGTLLSKGLMTWEGIDTQPLSQAVSEFFSASCVPGAGIDLCQLCGDWSSTNPYSGGHGALKCLKDNVADVAFLSFADIPENERDNYELLCQDNSRKNLNAYESCNLGKVPAHAVVTRNGDPELAENIWTNLNTVTGFDLFSSEGQTKNLLFSDSTTQLLQLPRGTDRFTYLSREYLDKLQFLQGDVPRVPASIRWCAVGHSELLKCDRWSVSSTDYEDGTPAIECHAGSTVEECFQKIIRHEADAVAVDGGQVYTAGKCGLVPAMAAQYDERKCTCACGGPSSYYAVAVIKRGSGVTWANLNGKRSCHTGMGRAEGWNIPMGLIRTTINSCDFSQFFSSGCVPGAEYLSSFCMNCKGDGQAINKEKCKPSADELYYGDAGAFRCLAEGSGDVAFIKHTTVGENTDGNGPPWARGMDLMSADFQLICPARSVPIDEYETCNLGQVPAHAVITRPDIRSKVVRVLIDQQAKYGPKGSESFRMFESGDVPNLLFTDSTKCLQETQTDSYETFLGTEYMNIMRSIRECTEFTPDLEKSCAFQTCQ